MAIAEINRWLQSERDYDEGVALYNKHGTNDTLKRVLSWGESSFNTDKLREELQAISEASEKKKRVVIYDPVPDERKSAELVVLYREQSMLHNQLKKSDDRKERYELAYRIEEIRLEIEDLLKGKVLLSPDQLPENPMEMMKLLTNNRSYISKFKADPSKAAKVEFREKQNEAIEKRLNE